MGEYAIIPRPASVKYAGGRFLSRGLPRAAGAFGGEARVFEAQLAAAFGEGAFSGGEAAIRACEIPAEGAAAAGEFYWLEILPDGIRLAAAGAAGAFRGFQALRQLFLSGFSGGELSVPCGTVEDWPRYPWRGLMLDCSRTFFPAAFVKKLLDALSLHHVSVLHWHLTDDQGWRLPVRGYPLLTEIGSVRYDSRFRRRVGGFYSEEEIRGIVAYAAERHIEVVPEVDLPGHTSAVLAAYPGLGCAGGPYRVEDRFGICEDVLCAGNDGIFDLAEAVFDALAGLFPSKFVHIGGDEVVFKHWQECPKCQRRIAELGLDSAPQLQSWITSRLAGMLRERGRAAIGWDEILDNAEKFPLPEDAVVMSWRSSDGGKAAAAMGRRVVMTPLTGGCYLDYRHLDCPDEIGVWWGSSTVAQGLALDPAAGMGEGEAALVLGGQGNLWTEALYAGKLAEYMVFPRICAIAEALWTAGADRDVAEFGRRLAVHRLRLDALGLQQYRGPLG